MVGQHDAPTTKATDHRATEMHRLRTEEHLTFVNIAQRYGRSPERVKQIIRLYCHAEGLPFPGRLTKPDRRN